MEYCLFQLGHNRYAVPLAAVREVLSHPSVSPVPLSPPELSGMTSFRGEVLPVFTLDSLLMPEQARTEPGERSRVLVLNFHESIYGIWVDQVERMEADAETLPEPNESEDPLLHETHVHDSVLYLLNPALLHSKLESLFQPAPEIF
ncbi:MAG: chemotaxis protein CheW [Methylacidiphilales bacterium]|nr:chemotaxis protein CheW [Candidatus Methylacidiphilales bacterium]